MKTPMKKRLTTAGVLGLLGAAMGVVIGLQLARPSNAVYIALATGLFAFLFGLVFKFQEN